MNPLLYDFAINVAILTLAFITARNGYDILNTWWLNRDVMRKKAPAPHELVMRNPLIRGDVLDSIAEAKAYELETFQQQLRRAIDDTYLLFTELTRGEPFDKTAYYRQAETVVLTLWGYEELPTPIERGIGKIHAGARKSRQYAGKLLRRLIPKAPPVK